MVKYCFLCALRHSATVYLDENVREETYANIIISSDLGSCGISFLFKASCGLLGPRRRNCYGKVIIYAQGRRSP